MKAGAIGYLLKDTDSEEPRAIKAAQRAGYSLHRGCGRLMREVRAPENPESLTDRETEVLKLRLGKANKQIAQSLLSEKTVKAHVSAILMKLGVQSRTQACALRAQGLVSWTSSATRRGEALEKQD